MRLRAFLLNRQIRRQRRSIFRLLNHPKRIDAMTESELKALVNNLRILLQLARLLRTVTQARAVLVSSSGTGIGDAEREALFGEGAAVDDSPRAGGDRPGLATGV